MTKTLTPKQVLGKARQMLRKRGAWAKGSFEDTNDDGTICHCLAGIINTLTLGYPVFGSLPPEDEAKVRPTYEALYEAINGRPPHDTLGIHDLEGRVSRFNDASATTKKDVLDLIGRAKELA